MKVVAVLSVIAALLVACGGGDKTRDVTVSLTEWRVTTSAETVAAGKVRFSVENAGALPHEFVVIKSDLPPEGLPVQAGKVIEDQVNIVDEIEPFAAGATEEITLDLSPGKYLLICNIVELPPGQPPVSHYQNGMVAFFLVEPEAIKQGHLPTSRCFSLADGWAIISARPPTPALEEAPVAVHRFANTGGRPCSAFRDR